MYNGHGTAKNCEYYNNVIITEIINYSLTAFKLFGSVKLIKHWKSIPFEFYLKTKYHFVKVV